MGNETRSDRGVIVVVVVIVILQITCGGSDTARPRESNISTVSVQAIFANVDPAVIPVRW